MKWLALSCTFLVCCVAVAQQPRISATLLADHASVEPGKSFLVAVRFQIEPEWHIYWKNPGDAGMASSVDLSGPPGFTFSELIWPVPTQFTQGGDILGYGYEREAMLMARVTPPADFTGPAEIKASVRWLACKEICIPGRAALQTSVNVGSVETQANRETFAEWLRRVPMDLGESPLSVTVRRSGMSYELTVAGVSEQAELDVFVAPPEGVSVRSIKRTGGKAVIEFARLAGSTVRGSAEVVVGNNATYARVLLPME